MLPGVNLTSKRQFENPTFLCCWRVLQMGRPVSMNLLSGAFAADFDNE